MWNQKVHLIIVVVLAAILLVGTSFLFWPSSEPRFMFFRQKVNFGVSALPGQAVIRLIEKKGWDKSEHLKIKSRFFPAADLPLALAKGKIDVAIMNFADFQSGYAQMKKGGKEIIFFIPFYIDKGDALLLHPESKIKTLTEIQQEFPEDKNALKRTLKQLKGKIIYVAPDSSAKALLLQALSSTGLKTKDAKITDAAPDKSLALFKENENAILVGNLRQQIAARKENARPFIYASDLRQFSVFGLVTTKKYALKHPAAMESLANLWFQAIQNILVDPAKRTRPVIKDLSRRNKFDFSGDDFALVFKHAGIFPDSQQAAADLLTNSFGPYYWQTAWEESCRSLIKHGIIIETVPYDTFWKQNLPAAIIRQ